MFSAYSQLHGRLLAEHPFQRTSALELLVLETIAQIALNPEFLAQLRCGTRPERNPVAFSVIETVQPRIRSESDIFRLQVPRNHSIHDIIYGVVQRNLLDGVHHIVDILLLFR